MRPLEAAQAPLLTRRHFAQGDPGPLVSSLAQVPELLEIALPFIGPPALSRRTKVIVRIR
ncbi:hypothetical protein [Nonomuraea sediminis]|uniref:hypothetical protein n=1 Tax=Nonomuraea sediminis TaxID=2835864 RepID=UPI001BDCF7FC|nr:hypothetical protein [Nonomuraea sediminis]